ncbi:hypothetical protein C3B58_20255 [Lactonifactor longoviformis]|uniref:Uncharacterized protein n=1 Tax=Lactonifactor longoviformis DSM 17459 TaxID=1122155 RepID=A0A1M4ZSU0_9CLOT|nr:hypothetical protein [Lactonifactor longoviformis]POP30637.1 hypothetical protein C3B58_20255 [Lactonifactor longoviformis]SHF21143.1 hypothetical protein SAMN02745158_02905 [Lactonifactor longoviformis DSM 17459]
MVGAQVVHKKYGRGKVLDASISHIMVKFAGCEVPKKFIYPDSFKKFLLFEDPVLESKAMADVELREKQIKAEEEKKLIEFKKFEEERKRKQLELLKKKRKAARAKKEKELRELEKKERLRLEAEQESG